MKKAIFFGLVLASPLLFSQNSSQRPKFKKQKIELGTLSLNVEVARTPDEQAYGLMFLTKLNTDQGMLFVFSDESPRSFWMKNTFVPLSIAFFNREKKLLNILDMKPAVSEMVIPSETYPSLGPAQYALEMPQGWFERNKIKPGAKLKINSDVRPGSKK